MLKWKGYKVCNTIAALSDAKEPKLIYKPCAEELFREEFREAFFKWVYLRRNTVVYIDEVFGVTNGQIIPEFYHAIMTRGRELGIGVISSTQRPVSIPIVLKSEAEHRFIFRLKNDNDRRIAEDISNVNADLIRQLPKYRFYYSNDAFDIVGPMKLKI